MDGVAAGVGAIAAINLVLFDRIFNGGHIVPLALILAGSALGFLRHNFPPARIFMGDSGSGFLGFTVATLAVMGSYRDVSNVLLAVLVPAMIAAVPIFDTAMVTLTRLLHRRPLFQGGRDHPAHRLVAIGLPERRAVLLLYGLSALAGTSALAASLLGLWMGVAASVVLVLGFVALGLALADLHIYEEMPPSRNGTPLPAPFQNKKWIALMGLDIALVAIAYVSAYLLRFEGRLPETLALDVARTLPLMLAAKMIGLAIFGAYRGDWRYAGLVDLVRLVQGVSVGSLLGVMLLFMWMRLEGISRAALTIDWLLTLLLLAATRLSVRLVREYLVAQATGGRRALIFGTGEAGTALLSVLRSNGEPAYHPVGFVDDDPARRGALVRGVPVLGTPRELGMLIHRHRVEEVLVVMQLCHPEVLEDIVSACRDAGIPARQFGLLADLPL
jgi:UDP-GlcNAc:undecaprenyl-phosphate GlcNAc-1-phosphate transferase